MIKAVPLHVLNSPGDAVRVANGVPIAVICLDLTDPMKRPDNVADVCTDCGEDVQRRPDIPTPSRVICVECFKALDPDKVGAIAITRKTLGEETH